MDKSHVRLIQQKLADMGFYKGIIDGDRGDLTHKAVLAGMGGLGQGVPEGFETWTDKRRTVGFLQAYAASKGIEAGTIDGFWGPQTTFAADALAELLATGQVRNFLDELPAAAVNPHGFPDESRTQKEIVAFYGKKGEANGSFRPPMEKVPVPWTMKIAWDKTLKRDSLWVHEKAAPSLKRVLDKVAAAYSPAQISGLGIDLFGGDYAPRTMRGASRASVHSWGIAFDFDPERNGLKMNRFQARLGQPDAIPFWEAWESEGWCSLGRSRNFDFMHVQACARAY